ncbi:hypothetical protein [Methylorubrum suomiense]|uniref:Uncharacterized protein n=1 Tax=Methylorubrum suomiense TaxID=144191 RepID=A0ABQ4V335_9HYPH|nr:hypothetical protein [Methylorubrum suomiense]GJE78068.1 hypothetical protein BGCPKDLD_4679 [Methylorubrum suomiense]
MRAILILLASTVVAGAEPASRADRALVVAWAKGFFADPYSLRSTEISDRTVVNGVSVLCVAFNARNLAGGYAGIYRKPFEITPAGLVPGERSYRVNTETCYAPQITMRPFPELSAIK